MSTSRLGDVLLRVNPCVLGRAVMTLHQLGLHDFVSPDWVVLSTEAESSDDSDSELKDEEGVRSHSQATTQQIHKFHRLPNSQSVGFTVQMYRCSIPQYTVKSILQSLAREELLVQ